MQHLMHFAGKECLGRYKLTYSCLCLQLHSTGSRTEFLRLSLVNVSTSLLSLFLHLASIGVMIFYLAIPNTFIHVSYIIYLSLSNDIICQSFYVRECVFDCVNVSVFWCECVIVVGFLLYVAFYKPITAYY